MDKTYLSLTETQEYLGIGRTALYELRLDRKHAKTDADKASAFAPEFEINGRVKFRRNDIDEWFTTRASAVGRRRLRARDCTRTKLGPI